MAVGLGHKSFLQVGREATYGTGVAATARCEIVSSDIKPTILRAQDPSLNNQASRRALFTLGYLYEGTIRIRWNYLGVSTAANNAYLLLLDSLMGTATFGAVGGTTAVVADTSAYVHTFIEPATSGFVNSLSMELIEGDIGLAGVAGKCRRLLGTKITGATFTIEAADGEAGLLYAEFRFVCKSVTESFTITAALTSASSEAVLFTHASLIDDGVNTSGQVVKGVEIRLESNLTSTERLQLGTNVIAEPLRNNFLTVTARIRQDFMDTSMSAVAIAGTVGSPEFTFTGTTLAGAATIYEAIRFRMSEAKITGFSNPIQNYGLIEQTTEWEAYRSATNADSSALTIICTDKTIAIP